MSAKLFKDGYKLNLCYITDRIAVMGNFYENDTLNELRRFLGCKHHNHHTIYNVSSEAEYNIEQDLENVRTFPINASNPCAIRTLLTLCGDVDAYINNHSSNVVIFHCKTGLGRSCMVAACYLLHTGVCTSAAQAIAFVNRQRTPETLPAISVPSQIRYIHYYEALLRSESALTTSYRVTHIRIITVPSFSSALIDCGCSPTVSLSVLARSGTAQTDVAWYPRRVFNQMDALNGIPPRRYSAERDSVVDIPLNKHNVIVRGDVCLAVFSEGEKMCQLYFNTSFVKNQYLCFEKETIDMAAEDTFHYTFDANFKIEIAFQEVSDDPSLNILGLQRPQNISKEEWEFIHNFGDTNIEEQAEEVADIHQ